MFFNPIENFKAQLNSVFIIRSKKFNHLGKLFRQRGIQGLGNRITLDLEKNKLKMKASHESLVFIPPPFGSRTRPIF